MPVAQQAPEKVQSKVQRRSTGSIPDRWQHSSLPMHRSLLVIWRSTMATETGPVTAHERTPLFVGSVDDVGELLTYGDIRQVAKTYAL